MVFEILNEFFNKCLFQKKILCKDLLFNLVEYINEINWNFQFALFS